MNPDLRELYQEIILDHGQHPRNHRAMDNASIILDGFNPLCGDKLRLYLKLDNNTITDISFKGNGCAISMASASLMTQALKGATSADARNHFNCFHDMVTQDNADTSTLGKLAVLAGVKEFPARVKCATLAWHTLIGALDGNQDPVTTE